MDEQGPVCSRPKSSKMTIAKIRVPKIIQMNVPEGTSVKSYIGSILNEKKNKWNKQTNVHDSGITFIERDDRNLKFPDNPSIPTIRVITYVGKRIKEKNKLPPAKVSQKKEKKRMRQISGQTKIDTFFLSSSLI